MVSSLIYVMPLLAFLFIFVVCFALFSKTKILGGSGVTNVLVSFLIAAMFVLNPPATKFTIATMPWIAVLIFVLLFVMLILAFVRGNIDDLVQSKIVALILVVAVLLVFLAAAVNVFGPLMSSIAAGNLEPVQGTSAELVFNPAVLGALILLIVAGVTYYFFTK